MVAPLPDANVQLLNLRSAATRNMLLRAVRAVGAGFEDSDLGAKNERLRCWRRAVCRKAATGSTGGGDDFEVKDDKPFDRKPFVGTRVETMRVGDENLERWEPIPVSDVRRKFERIDAGEAGTAELASRGGAPSTLR